MSIALMLPRCFLVSAIVLSAGTAALQSQTEIGASRLSPNLTTNIDRPLRYRPDGGDFVIVNGGESFNRPLYGGNTAFRVDGGDKPEFVLYLPGRGGNVRLGVRSSLGTKWLIDAASIETRYRPGELVYEIKDPVLGAGGVLRIEAVAYAATEGLGLQVSAEGTVGDAELVWAFGGVNGQRGKRDGDIGTESVPISQWFQLRAEFCRNNTFDATADGFRLTAKPATILGVSPAGASLAVGSASNWGNVAELLRTAAALGTANAANGEPASPVLVGRAPLGGGTPLFLSFQRMRPAVAGPEPADLETYREVTAKKDPDPSSPAAAAPVADRAPLVITRAELPARFTEAREHFARLRARVSVETPDPFINAAFGALNVAADAVWDDPQQAIMHGAIAWRTKLLGWRGPYSLDALGWHDRMRRNATYWMSRQNTGPIPAKVPPPDENANLARNEAGLHTNGDLSNSHYDMNLVFIDGLFRHLQWTGDLEFARRAWPVIERHLAWERRLFRREFGPEKLPLYEAYAAIWASDDLQYGGGGTMHASAYNYYENRQAARLARLLGHDSLPYDREADLLARGMRELLWVAADDRGDAQTGRGPGATPGWFAESKDLLGAQRVHPSAALWTFYHSVDSEVPTSIEAWQMAQRVKDDLPLLPVRGKDVPAGFYTLGTSNWMPYDWSINNVVMAEAVHGALGFWQAGRGDEAWAITKGSLLAAMYMGISPGNIGSMSYLDVYRRESQRDFADGSGVLSRALVEGLFGVKPDVLAGELRITPGWPKDWPNAAIRHPDFSLRFERHDREDSYAVGQHFPRTLALRLTVVAGFDDVAGVTVDGRSVAWQPVIGSVGQPRIEILVPPTGANGAGETTVRIRWAGQPVVTSVGSGTGFTPAEQGKMRWWQPPRVESPWLPAADPRLTGLVPLAVEGATFDPVNLAGAFNDRVTQIFQNQYRKPRSPFVSLAIPKQGIGGWAGGVNKSASIDDSGLRAAAANAGGRILLPNGVPFVTPADSAARNIVFVSQWDNYPRQSTVALSGSARGAYFLLAGSTNAMQSRFENGVVTVTYADGGTVDLSLVNPTNWWPIEQDYFVDDFQFRRPEPLPIRVDLKTGRVRVLDAATFKGKGATIPGGAATVLSVPLDPTRELKSLTVRATANDVVIGLLAATLVR